MNYLLDVNTLVAWGWADHVDHERVDVWLADLIHNGKDKVLTSAIPELGFVRVSVQRGAGKVTLEQATTVLKGMLATLGKLHHFLPDDQPVQPWPKWCRGAGKTTDAHLLKLATAHGHDLATLDQGISGAFLIP